MDENTTDVESTETDATLDAVDHNALGMSDEDFMNMDPAEFENANADDTEDNEDGVEEQPEEGNETNSESLGDDQDEQEDDDDVNGDEEDDAAADSDADETDEDTDDSDEQPTKNASNYGKDVDYEAEYKKLFAPIKSSGREIKMRNVDHVRNYVQMGDDYNKKMHEIKPYMKSLRTLKEHKILGDDISDDRLNFLIELDQKKPEAIKRLIAESGMDIYELQDEDKFSPEQSKQYQPEDQMVSEGSIEIEDALKSISSSPAYDQTINVMTKEFDAESRDIIAENPGYIKSLNADIVNGSYEKIIEEVQYARDMKMISADLSDIEAYIATVTMLHEQSQHTKGKAKPPAGKTTTRKAKGSNRKKKVGMSSSSTVPAKKNATGDQDYIGMSDEDFANLDTGVL